MNYIQSLIEKHCPNGVEFRALGEVCDLTRGRVISQNYLRTNAGQYPVYSSQTKNNGIFGKINSFDFDGEYVSWTTDGANAGSVFYINGKFSITNVCGLLRIKDKGLLNAKFLYFVLCIIAKMYVNYSSGNPKLMSNKMATIQIPIPPLEIQCEIVKILDSFTELEKELEKELEMRRKQYEYYREKLLSFESLVHRAGGGQFVKMMRLGKICKCFAGGTPKTNISAYWDNGTISWMSSGEVNKGTIYETDKKITQLGYDKSSTKMIPPNSVVLALAGQGKTRGSVARIKISLCTNQSLCAIVPNEDLNYNFLYFYLKNQYKQLRQVSSGDGTRGGLNLKMVQDFQIPIPPLKVQNEVVEILDRFDKLTNDISEGIPAEINTRKKQYEYYREQLLTFKEIA